MREFFRGSTCLFVIIGAGIFYLYLRPGHIRRPAKLRSAQTLFVTAIIVNAFAMLPVPVPFLAAFLNFAVWILIATAFGKLIASMQE